MKKMFFPKDTNVGNTGFIAGQINEVEETSGSVQRWIIRGCTIVDEKPIVDEEEKVVEDVKVEDVKVEDDKPSKTKKNKKPSKK